MADRHLNPDDVAAQAAARGLAIDVARAQRFLPGLNSLLTRLQRLSALIPRDTAPRR